MIVLNGETGKKIAMFPTGSCTNAAGFDAQRRLIFMSNGEGDITVVHQKSADQYVAELPIVTQPSAKTMVFDTKTSNVFLPTATVVLTPSADSTQKPKRTITDGTFVVLVVGR